MRKLLCLALLAVLAMPTWSDTLPPPTSAVTCTADKAHVEAASDCIAGGARASLTLLPLVGEQVKSIAAAEDIDGPHGAGAFADIQYSFQVVGGRMGDLVPVLFTVNLAATASSADHAVGFASIIVTTSQGSTQVCVLSNGIGCPIGAYSGTFGVMASAGDLGNRVDLEVSASAGDSRSTERAAAAADPLIFIDPGFAGAGRYSIALSPGVGNAVPVPEPATAALLSAGGLWFMALAARRPKRAVR